MTAKPIIMVNHLKVQPGKQEELIALLERNVEDVVRTLSGWRTTRLIASKDGAGVIIYSEWETQAAFDAMHSNPRMTAFFPQVSALAEISSVIGEEAFSGRP